MFQCYLLCFKLIFFPEQFLFVKPTANSDVCRHTATFLNYKSTITCCWSVTFRWNKRRSFIHTYICTHISTLTYTYTGKSCRSSNPELEAARKEHVDTNLTIYAKVALYLGKLDMSDFKEICTIVLMGIFAPALED